MNNDTDTFPLFFQLIEQKGEKTENVIKEIKKLAFKFNIEDSVILHSINQTSFSAEENALVYEVKTNPNSKDSNSMEVIEFLSCIFEKMFDCYPSYIEPPL